jgi:hypothetical protein
VRLAPLEREAAEMIRALRAFPLLDGYRGRARADLGVLSDMDLAPAVESATEDTVP